MAENSEKQLVRVTVTPSTQLREGAKAPVVTLSSDRVPRTDVPISVTGKATGGKKGG